MEQEIAIPDELKPVYTVFMYQVWQHHFPQNYHWRYTEDERSRISEFLECGTIASLPPRYFLLACLVRNRDLMSQTDVQSAYMLCGENPGSFPIPSKSVNEKRGPIFGYFDALLREGSVVEPETLIPATFQPGKCRECVALWKRQPLALQSCLLSKGEKLKDLVLCYTVPPSFCKGIDKFVSINVAILGEMLDNLDKKDTMVVIDLQSH